MRNSSSAPARTSVRRESYTIPVAILVLVLIFGTLVAAALPVIGGGMAVTVTLGIFWLLAQVLDISVFAMNVATLLGLAVGIDYALFMVGRFREELAGRRAFGGRRGRDDGRHRRPLDLLQRRHRGRQPAGPHEHPVHVDALMGLGGALVVSVSVLAALTLLPAMLGMLGHRVNSIRVIGRRAATGCSGVAGATG